MLVFTGGEFERLRAAMLADAPLETACFILAEPVRVAGSAWRLIVSTVIPLQQTDYRRRTESFIELEATALAAAAKRARLSNQSLVLAHTHPVLGPVGPSLVDIDGEESWCPAVQRRIPDLPLGRLIIGRNATHAGLLGPHVGGDQVVPVVDVGSYVSVVTDVADTTKDAARVHRQVLAFGNIGQQVIQGLRVAIIGCGGTGSVTIQQLAYLGVSDFLLIDPDTIEESNLNRVVGATRDDIGRLKVDVAREMIHAVNPEANVDVVAADVCESSVARGVLTTDAFFCCTDSEGSRAVLNQLAYQFVIPGFDMGVVIRAQDGAVTHINARVQMLTPGEPCLLCGEALDAEQVRRDLLTSEARAADRYVQGTRVVQPAVITINSAAASMAVTMMLSAFTGIPIDARHQRIRFERGIVTRVSVAAQATCPVCSPTGVLRRGDSFAMPGRD